jgi:hypothetical protein
MIAKLAGPLARRRLRRHLLSRSAARLLLLLGLGDARPSDERGCSNRKTSVESPCLTRTDRMHTNANMYAMFPLFHELQLTLDCRPTLFRSDETMNDKPDARPGRHPYHHF